MPGFPDLPGAGRTAARALPLASYGVPLLLALGTASLSGQDTPKGVPLADGDVEDLAERILRQEAFAWNPRRQIAIWSESYTAEGVGSFDILSGPPDGQPDRSWSEGNQQVETFHELSEAKAHLERLLREQPAVAVPSIGRFDTDTPEAGVGGRTLTLRETAEGGVEVWAEGGARPVLELQRGDHVPRVTHVLWAEDVPFVALHVTLHPVPPNDVVNELLRFVRHRPGLRN